MQQFLEGGKLKPEFQFFNGVLQKEKGFGAYMMAVGYLNHLIGFSQNSVHIKETVLEIGWKNVLTCAQLSLSELESNELIAAIEMVVEAFEQLRA